ncbi:helix-turn-helix domain-containing protein [Microbacterium sp. B24]|uniref:helix-turn-helix domain-containing protein n=1 Tax=Microbacterium sp. B24 TaxID=95616 RepID=UPI0011D22177|nr:helix-turn-helix domain-containing protein [Microbacterium sp. B24]
MTPALLELVISDYRSGLSVYAIAETHGIHRQTVTTHLVKAGVTLRRTITDAERQRARKLYDSGAYIKDIAKMLGRNPATIAKMVRPREVASSPRARTAPAPGTPERACPSPGSGS